MEFTADAVKAIQQPAIDAERLTKAVTIVDSPDPRQKWLVQSGRYETVAVPPPFRKHLVRSLLDLIAYATDLTKAVVWHCPEGVVLVLDDDDRRDTVYFPLEFSEAWTKLCAIEQQSALTQKDMIRLLRFYLNASAETITLFRKLDFKVISEGGGEIQKSKESLGRSITAEVHGAADLPEELFVEVPIYSNCGERQEYKVRLLLEYDAQAQRIVVVPKPGRIAELEEEHQTDIRASSGRADRRCGWNESHHLLRKPMTRV